MLWAVMMLVCPSAPPEICCLFWSCGQCVTSQDFLIGFKPSLVFGLVSYDYLASDGLLK